MTGVGSSTIPPPPGAGGPDAPDPAPDADGAESQVAGSLLALGGGAMAARVVAFVGTAYLARVLGPDAFGVIGFALALVVYFRLAVDGGFSPVGAREVASHPERAAGLAASVILFRLLLAVGAFVALGLVAWVLPKPVDVRLVVVLMGLQFFGLATDTSWVYKGLERNRAVGIALVLAEVASVAVLVAFVHSPDDLLAAPLALAGGQFVASAYLAWPLFRGGRVVGRLREGAALFRSASALVVSKLMRVLFFSFDVLLLGFLVGDAAVGLYTAAYRVCFVVTALGVALTFSYLPEFTRAARRARADVAAVADRSLELSSVLVAPIVVGGVVLAGPLLAALFGAPYAGAAVAFQLLLPSVGLSLLRGTASNVMLTYDRLGWDMWILVGATALNVVLNVVLIPRYGIEGAAVATLVAEALNAGVGVAVAARLGVSVRVRPYTRSLAAAAVMAGVLVLVPSLHVFVRVVLGGAVYLGALAALRGIPADARPHLRALLVRLRLV